ncbi:MAG: hypothetical protein R1F52_02750 [Candidatus Nitrosoabyssus spongiisocia]|nr:MAG: hypothetical protein R1F52_02750 [Nitrosopumilaceae archaeon AB1(1)]
MIKISKKPKKNDVSFIGVIWVSSILAMIFTLPVLGIIFGVHHLTGNWVLGIILGVITHFTTLIFSGRISRFLTRSMTDMVDQV